MMRWFLASCLTAALAIAPATAQTSTPAKPSTPQTQKPAPAKPAAPTTKPAPSTAKPAPSTAAPAASTAKPTAPATPATAVKYGPGVYAHFTTNQGSFIVRLFDKDAPITVQNFIGLAEGKKAWTDPRTGRSVRRPYYNNLTFHRIIPNFMIQGGDPTGTGFSGPGFKFNDEISPKLKHDRPGILSMANSGPNTNGGQFFITVAPYPSLDGKYSIFGEVVEGLDRVVAISKVPTSGPKGDPPNKPLSPVVMKSVRVERVS
jgi:peptidyl-prolyl cis-trans isomerase A (cyclophilin A)